MEDINVTKQETKKKKKKKLKTADQNLIAV